MIIETTPEADFQTAQFNGEDRWVNGCGGSERPFLYNGTRWLYVYNPKRHEHGYLNLDTDIVNEDFRGIGPEIGAAK